MIAPEKLLKNRVVMVAGDEDILRREAFTSLMEATGVQADDFDLEYFTADASKPGDWLASVGTSPFLAERRIVVVRHLLRCDPEKTKATELAGLPPSSLLILVADDEGGSDEKKARSPRKAWEKLVTTGGGAVVSCDSNPKEIKDEVKRRAIQMGRPLTEKALDILLEMTGSSLSRALDELNKINLFVTSQGNVTEADVRRVAVPSREWNVFRLVDSVFNDNVGEALSQLRILVGSANKAEDAAFSRILPMVSRQLRFLWQARLCIDAKCAPGNPTDAVRAMFPSKPDISAEPPYRQSALMKTAQRLTLPRLERCFAILSDTDARLKGILDAYTSVETLERMVLDMTAA